MTQFYVIAAWCAGSLAILDFLRRLRRLTRAALAVAEALRHVTELTPRVDQLTASMDALTRRFDAVERQIIPPAHSRS